MYVCELIKQKMMRFFLSIRCSRSRLKSTIIVDLSRDLEHLMDKKNRIIFCLISSHTYILLFLFIIFMVRSSFLILTINYYTVFYNILSFYILFEPPL